MNKKVIIIIFIFILIIIGASTAIYLFMNKPSDEVPKEQQKDEEETAEEEKVEDEIPVDAKCREDIEDSFYQFEDTPIKGSDILSNLKNFASQFIRTIKQHIFKERFAIESNFITDKTQLENNKKNINTHLNSLRTGYKPIKHP
jgi:flagellar biosynthesis/type III secretory pathway M-ring protein FliF/YscJ